MWLCVLGVRVPKADLRGLLEADERGQAAAQPEREDAKHHRDDPALSLISDLAPLISHISYNFRRALSHSPRGTERLKAKSSMWLIFIIYLTGEKNPPFSGFWQSPHSAKANLRERAQQHVSKPPTAIFLNTIEVYLYYI